MRKAKAIESKRKAKKSKSKHRCELQGKKIYKKKLKKIKANPTF